MNKIFVKITLFFIILTAFFVDAVENSVIPVMETFECIENLPTQKLTKNQFSEIANALEKKEEMIRLVTYNMLFNLYDHNLDEENRWPNRLPRIVELIHEMQPDIINTQELYPTQVQDIVNLIGDDFSFFPGKKDEDGESYGIFYRTDRFELLSSQIDYPLSMVQLKDLKTEKIIHVFNSHMPLSNIEKREANAHKIAQIIEPFAKQTAVIFTGDLNTFPGRFDLKDLPFYDGDYIHRILSKGSLKNSHQESLLGHFGPISTFTNSSTDVKPFQGTGTPGIILDYIYVSKKVTVLTHAVEHGTVDGHFPSDHMPVLIDFLIN
ncbi:MAG: endonuclease/exonuclease/phosphatase family protein [Parachlamydiaceae bacterium]|nr:endonuclease/exonuclease/phosphatase family protein [Parachlamydiaceae bacterium]